MSINDKIWAAKDALEALISEYQSGLEVFEPHCFLYRSKDNCPNGAMVVQLIKHRMIVVESHTEFSVKLGDKIIGEGFETHDEAHEYGLIFLQKSGYYLNHSQARNAANKMAHEQSTEGMSQPMYL